MHNDVDDDENDFSENLICQRKRIRIHISIIMEINRKKHNKNPRIVGNISTKVCKKKWFFLVRRRKA